MLGLRLKQGRGVHGRRAGRVAAGLLAAMMLPASAATITVNSLDDQSVDDDQCTLREAITNANSNLPSPTNGCAAGELTGDNIVFAESIQGDTITLDGSQLPELGGLTAGPLTITGPVTIDADDASRIFTNAGNSTLVELTLINGMTAGGDASASDRSGGAILNVAGGVLTINGGTMNNNTSDRAGGAIEDESNEMNAVTLNGVDFSGNNAGMNPGNGGVLHVTGAGGVTVMGGTFDNNMAVEGGALWNNQGVMTVDGASFTGNTATATAGDSGGVDGQGGGAIFAENGAGSVTVTNSTFADNMAMGDVSSGGAIFANEGTTLSISMTSFTGNTANRAGGAIETRANTSTTLDQVSLDGNTANTTAGGGGGNGGGLHVTGNGNVDITVSEIVDNTAATEGGGLWNNTGTMTVDGSTVSNNTANGIESHDGGGGIFNNSGDGGGAGSVEISNSIITGNEAPEGAGSGGGIFNNTGGSLTVDNTRISGNSAQRAGGGIETVGSTQVTLTVVDLSGNTTGPMPGNGGGLHVSGDGNVDVVNSFVGGNQAASEGGGLWNNTGVMNISGTSLVGNSALGGEPDQGGGAVFNNNNNGDGMANGTVNIRLSRIADNVASGEDGSGGGIFANTGGTVNVFDTRIESNVANRAGGGIESKDATVNLSRVVLGGLSAAQGNDAGTNPGNGGGLHVTGAGTTTVVDSSVGYNVASEGGGLWNFNTGTMTVTNTTVSNNQAMNPNAGGGGVFQQLGEGSGMTLLQFTTVARNMTAGNGGGVSAPGEGQMIDADDGTLIAENSAEGMGANVDGPGAMTEDALVADMAGIDNLQLFGGRFDGPLDGIGDSGPTITATGVHPLQMGSAAIDGGPATCAPLTGDQRGAARPNGDNCDAGAFEAAGNPVLSVSNNNTSPIIVNSGDQVVFPVLAVGVTNNGDESVTAGGLSGILEVDRIPAQPLDFANVDAELYVDDDGNGLADDGNEPVGSVDVNANGTFRVSFGTGGQAFAAGESTNYVVTVALPGSGSGMADAGWQTPVFAGGTLLALLGLFSVGGLSRRLRWVLAIGVATAGLAACGGSNGGGLFDPPGDDEELADLRFVAVTLDAPASVSTDDFLIGDGLPVRGPGINFDDN